MVQFKSDNPSWTREYECDYYKCNVHPKSCLFCIQCEDVFFDYTHGPYMFICNKGQDTDMGMNGKCKLFEE